MKDFCDKEGDLQVISFSSVIKQVFVFCFFWEGGGGGCMQAHKMLEGVRGVCLYADTASQDLYALLT